MARRTNTNSKKKVIAFREGYMNKLNSIVNQLQIQKEGNRTVGAGVNRDKVINNINLEARANTINTPVNPETCSGTSYKCNVTGSGKTPIKDVNTHAEGYDYLATPMTDANLTNRSFRLPVLHNWKNSTNETKFTKDSLRNTYGFENFQ